MDRCSACAFACLGPGDTYFFQSPNSCLKNNLPPAIEALFARNEVQNVYVMAIAPGGLSWVIAYQARSGPVALLRENLPPGLDAWLTSGGQRISRHLPSLEITLGPYGSYFARDSRGGFSWENLPTTLSTAIEERRDKRGFWVPGQEPRNVSLGFDGAWVYLTDSGSGLWDLRGQPGHQCLETYLREPKNLAPVDIYLDPHRPGSHLAVSMSGDVGRNMPAVFLGPCDRMGALLPCWDPRGKLQASSESRIHALNSGLEVTNAAMDLVNALASDGGGGDGGGAGDGGGGGGGGDGGGGAVAADGGGGGGGGGA